MLSNFQTSDWFCMHQKVLIFRDQNFFYLFSETREYVTSLSSFFMTKIKLGESICLLYCLNPSWEILIPLGYFLNRRNLILTWKTDFFFLSPPRPQKFCSYNYYWFSWRDSLSMFPWRLFYFPHIYYSVFIFRHIPGYTIEASEPW